MTMRSDFEAQLVSKDPDAATALKWFPELGRYYSMWIQASWEGFQLGYKAGIEAAHDAWADALQSDLENGVRSLNEAASKEFHEKYPEMAKLGEAIRQLGSE